MRSLRLVACVALTSAATLALTGCSMLGGPSDPERDDDTGEIVASSDDADVFALRVGDCLNIADLGESIESVPTRPCAEVHEAEIYASMMIDDGAYPGDAAVDTISDDFCYAEFSKFVGMSYEESAYDYTYLMPSQGSWEGNADREVLCVVVDMEGDATGTLAGING